MVTNFGIVKVVSEVGSGLMIPRIHINPTIDYCSSTSCAVSAIIAVDAELVA